MKSNTRRNRAGFSLIELMAVITIIVILAGLVVGGMGFVSDRQAKEKARVQIALLSKAIEEYKLDMGAYPGTTSAQGGASATGSGGDYSQVLYTALFYEGYDYAKKGQPESWPNKATKIYLPELDPTSTKQGWVTTSTTPGANLKIVDPWAANYLYRVGTLSNGTPNPEAQNPDFDLWTKGKNGKTRAAKGDDPKHADNKDDIRNF